MLSIKQRLTRYLESLRFPWLLLITSLLFVVNLFVPDAIPFIDEVLLALVAVILGKLKRKPGSADSQPTAVSSPQQDTAETANSDGRTSDAKNAGQS
jgi:hypothetical protein